MYCSDGWSGCRSVIVHFISFTLDAFYRCPCHRREMYKYNQCWHLAQTSSGLQIVSLPYVWFRTLFCNLVQLFNQSVNFLWCKLYQCSHARQRDIEFCGRQDCLNAHTLTVVLFLHSLPNVCKMYGAHLKASAAMVRLRLYDVLTLLPPDSFEGENLRTFIPSVTSQWLHPISTYHVPFL